MQPASQPASTSSSSSSSSFGRLPRSIPTKSLKFYSSFFPFQLSWRKEKEKEEEKILFDEQFNRQSCYTAGVQNDSTGNQFEICTAKRVLPAYYVDKPRAIESQFKAIFLEDLFSCSDTVKFLTTIKDDGNGIIFQIAWYWKRQKSRVHRVLLLWIKLNSFSSNKMCCR